MAIQNKTIEYVHQGTQLEGRLCWDDQIEGPRPGVLVSHAWAGRSGFEDDKAAELAKLGYAGFSLDLYGQGVLGTSVEENSQLMQPFLEDRQMLQARLGVALATLRSSELVDSANTAIMGYCFGGLCALDLARIGTDIKGAISIHGLFNPPGNTTSVSAKVLVLHGWDDPMAPPDSVLSLATELSEAGADWQVHAYGGTLHAFTHPEANDPKLGTAYSKAADSRSWQAIENFLAELF